MERAYFQYEIVTRLRLTQEDVTLLSKACESHYDHACRALSIAGPGAILNGARNELKWGAAEADGTIAVEATSHQLDTLAKACEMGLPAYYIQFRQLLKESHAEYRRLNVEHIKKIDELLNGLRHKGTGT